jgi:hypothetical protein
VKNLFAAIASMCLGIAMVGCASNQWFRSPSEMEIAKASSEKAQTTRFVRWPLTFVADFDLEPSHPLVNEMVDLRDRVATTLAFNRPEEPIQVFLYADDARYEAFWNERFRGTPVRRAVFLETPARKALYVHWGDKAAEDVRHEVTHGYLHALAPAIPLWLDEGLAEYFETPAEAHGKNLAHIDLLKRAQQEGNWEPSVKRLERKIDMTQMQQIDYAESWLWTYWLLNGDEKRRDILTDYLKAVRVNRDPGSLAADLEAKSFNNNESVKVLLEKL